MILSAIRENGASRAALASGEALTCLVTAIAFLSLPAPCFAATSTSTSGNTTTTSISYSGGIQTFTAPYTGTYTLEVWGGQGGEFDAYEPASETDVASYYYSHGNGGLGGYSKGDVSLNAEETIYIVAGGAGGSKAVSKAQVESYITSSDPRAYFRGSAGGYNGGGAGGASSSLKATSWPYRGSFKVGASGGGGATHIAKASGTLASLSSNRASVLLVAGGGGGGGWSTTHGGVGGGTSGGNASSSTTTAAGGTQSTGYAFGQGENGHDSTGEGGAGNAEGSSGAGGGWFGGRTHTIAGNPPAYQSIAGAGGSGYIGGVSNATTSQGVNSGNGKAAITYSRAITVTYNANGGSGGPASQTLGYGMNIDASKPVRTGYTFLGWSETQNGNVTVEAGGAINTASSTPTLYAVWQAPSQDSVSVTTAGNTTIASVSYSGSVKEFTAPYTGTYTLEAWGADGGDAMNAYGAGGVGGYTRATVTLNEGETIYVVVGGGGSNCTFTHMNIAGGYNGGGDAQNIISDEWFGSGGGATHFASKTGALSTLSSASDQRTVIAVAGGGGGGAYESDSKANHGGGGGGQVGLDGGSFYNPSDSITREGGKGGTQVAGGAAGIIGDPGSFGQGGSANHGSDAGYMEKKNGGGGGWYGGGNAAAWACGAGGGAGRVGGASCTWSGVNATGTWTASDNTTRTIEGMSVSSGTTGFALKPTSDKDGFAKVSYSRAISVTYNANGGENAPAAQTLGYGMNITSTEPTRAGFEFLGWSETQDGEVSVNAGGAIETDSPAPTLYAKWRFAAEVSGISEINPDEDGNGYGDNLAFSAPSDVSAVVKPDGTLMFPSSSYVQNLSEYQIEISAIESWAEGSWVLMSSLPANVSTENALCVSLKIGNGANTNITDYSSKTTLSGYTLTPDATKSLAWTGEAANISDTSSGDFASIKWYVKPAYE